MTGTEIIERCWGNWLGTPTEESAEIMEAVAKAVVKIGPTLNIQGFWPTRRISLSEFLKLYPINRKCR